MTWAAIYLQDGALHKLKDEVQLAVKAEGVQQAHHVVVPHVLQDLHLPHGRLPHLPRQCCEDRHVGHGRRVARSSVPPGKGRKEEGDLKKLMGGKW